MDNLIEENQSSLSQKAQLSYCPQGRPVFFG